GIKTCAYSGETLIADASVGTVSPQGRSVRGETLFPVFALAKAATAIALHLQAERGLIEYDAPVCEYWPEFSANGKHGITIRHVLSHRSGFPQVPAELTPELMTDWDWVVGRLAEMSPLVLPDTRNTYQ